MTNNAQPQIEPLADDIREGGIELDRIIFFSDAIYAIAITLLAFQVGFGSIPQGQTAAQLGRTVVGLLPRFLVYAQCFLMIGIFWVGHHRTFRYIRRYDTLMIWLNLLHLMFVAFLPVPSAVLATYTGHQSAVVFYATCMIFTGLMQFLLWRHATHDRRLVDPDFDPRLIRLVNLRIFTIIAVFLLAIAGSFVSLHLPLLIQALFYVAYVPLERAFHLIVTRTGGGNRQPIKKN